MKKIKNEVFRNVTPAEICRKADEIRKNIVEICMRNGAGHIASSLSSVDILSALYYGIMRLSTDPAWEDRDRLIFSKGHGCYGLYAILADLGYIKMKEWESFYRGSCLSGCLERAINMGIEASCGSLGHGLPIATGIAFGARLQHKRYRVYCIVGDGEMQEGSNWEAVQFAVKHQLSNLTIIIDHNRLQAMDFLENILTPRGTKAYLEKILKAFGCHVMTCDGHDVGKIISILKRWVKNGDRLLSPQAIVADTIKGYGLKCMENIPKFHFRLPTEEELEMGCRYEK